MKSLQCNQLCLALIVLNCFAFTVNYLGISPRFNIEDTNTRYEFFILSDTDKSANSSEQITSASKSEGFWPFEQFYAETKEDVEKSTRRFKGIFTGYETGEFIFYSLLITCVFVFLKVW